MNQTPNDPNLGREYAHPESRLARFIDEQHRLIEKYRLENARLREDVASLERESEYWKKECEKSDAHVKILLNPSKESY